MVRPPGGPVSCSYCSHLSHLSTCKQPGERKEYININIFRKGKWKTTCQQSENQPEKVKIRKESEKKKFLTIFLACQPSSSQENGNNTSTFYMPMKRKVKTICLDRHPISNNNQLTIDLLQEINGQLIVYCMDSTFKVNLYPRYIFSKMEGVRSYLSIRSFRASVARLSVL